VATGDRHRRDSVEFLVVGVDDAARLAAGVTVAVAGAAEVAIITVVTVAHAGPAAKTHAEYAAAQHPPDESPTQRRQ